MNEQKEFEAIKDACLSDGMKILLEDIKKNRDSTDTIKIMPIIDIDQQGRKTVISPVQDEMLKNLGYVNSLDWIIGLIEFYQSNEFQDNEDDL